MQMLSAWLCNSDPVGLDAQRVLARVTAHANR